MNTRKFKTFVQRPDWKTISDNRRVIDLSQNVHYDRILNQKVNRLISEVKSVHDYPNQYELYSALSGYYKIPLDNLTIGYGSTELIDRALSVLPISKLYIVEPAFQMVEVYCRMFSIPFEKINYEDISTINETSSIYLSNPNGNNGQEYDISSVLDKFEYILVDEVYGDFSDTYSLLNIDRDNVVVFKSISKSLGLAGLRVGFCKSSYTNTELLQSARSNYITSSIAAQIIPRVIYDTQSVVARMNESKKFLQNQFDCVKSVANYVLFKSPNVYTDRFGFRYVNGLYRMALADKETLLNV